MPPSAASVAARFYLLLEALIEGEVAPDPAHLDWAIDLLGQLDLPEALLDEAEADHRRMVASSPGPARREPRPPGPQPSPAPRRK